MGKRMGIWIDHREAVIVTIEGEEEKILKIESNFHFWVLLPVHFLILLSPFQAFWPSRFFNILSPLD